MADYQLKPIMKRVRTLTFLSLLMIAISGYIALKKHSEQVRLARELPDTVFFSGTLSNTPENESLYRLLTAEIALNREEPDIAVEDYIKVAQLSQDPIIAERATRLALNYSTEKMALIPALLWSQNAPDNIEAQLVSAGLLIITHQNTKALPYMQRALALNPQEGDRDLVSLYRQLKSPEIQEAYTQLIEQLQDKHQPKRLVSLALADIYLSQNKAQAAYEETQGLINMPPIMSQPLPERTYVLQAQALYQLEKVQAATAFLKQHLQQAPHHLLARMYYTELLLQQQNTVEAKQQLQQLAKLPDIPTTYLLQLARLSMEVQWYTEAKLFFMRVKEDPKDGNIAKYFLARLADIDNNPTEALSWYTQVDNGAFHISAFIRAGGILIEQKKYSDALALLDTANPESVDDYKRLVLAQTDIYSRMQNFNDAFELLTKSLVDLPQDIDLLYARALISIYLNNMVSAEKDLKDILNTQPNHVDALNSLGFILTNDTNRLDEAYTLLSKAITLAPTNPSVMDSLGWLYYKKGNTAEALKWLQAAAKLQPDADISVHLGEVLWQSGQKEAAQEIWATALKNYPNDPMVQKTVNRLLPGVNAKKTGGNPTEKK